MNEKMKSETKNKIKSKAGFRLLKSPVFARRKSLKSSVNKKNDYVKASEEKKLCSHVSSSGIKRKGKATVNKEMGRVGCGKNINLCSLTLGRGIMVLLALVSLSLLCSSFSTPAFAADTNVSLWYGWDGSSWIPMRVTATGELMTDLNLTESIGLNPKLNNTYTIGAAELRWSSGYFNTLYAGTISTVTGALTLGPASAVVDVYKSGTDSTLIVSDSAGATKVQLSSNGDTYFTGGNVGIGTTSPQNKLHVVGDLNVTGTAYLAAVNMSGLVYSEGNVGVGISAPTSKLHVVGNTNITGSLTVGGGIEGVTNVSVLYGSDGTNMKPLLVSSDGRLKLEIEQANAVNSSNLNAGATGVDLTLSGNLAFNTITSGTWNGAPITQAYLGGISLPSTNVTGTWTGGASLPAANITAGTFGAGNFNFQNNVSVGQNLSVGASTLFVDTKNSRVGIGTTNPGQKLDVEGNIDLSGHNIYDIGILHSSAAGNTAYINMANGLDIYASGGNSIRFGDGSTENVRIDSSGNVGIGTTSPGATLDVNSTSGSGMKLRGATEGDAWLNFYAGTMNTAGIAGRYTPDAGFLVFYTKDAGAGTSEKMRITDTGNVGIGTTSPQQKLDVVGNINATGNVTVSQGNRICLDGAATGCSKYIEYNGTHVVIQG